MFDVTLNEKRSFAPPKEFVKKSQYSPQAISRLRAKGRASPQKYWKEAALELDWFKKFKTVLKWKAPIAQWFVGGKINASYNCLDRHLAAQPEKAALVWEAETGECATWTYSELHREVETLTASLREIGLKPGDAVAIYMPMIPEAVVAMLACARGGFVHNVVFGGFSADALKDRMNDSKSRCLITADGGYRKGAFLSLEENAAKALEATPSVDLVIKVKRKNAGKLRNHLAAPSAPLLQGVGRREWDWHDLLNSISADLRARRGHCEELDSEHPLYVLYTSGTTGKPKGLVHTTGGYLAGVLRSFKLVFDIRADDLYWCTADIGWVTGHSYVVYGPLAAGASIFIYEGAPMQPGPDRFWQMIARHRITILYTAPTAIRAFMRLGDEPVKNHDLSSLRLLGSVGESINPEAWMWYRDVIGGGRCPIVDTYWQTETGSIVISPLPSETRTKPGSATKPLPGFDVAVLSKDTGLPVLKGQGGYLVIRKPWPSMARTIHGDPERFQKQYWSEFSGGVYFTGDGARLDKEGDLWCLGRVDDVLNVSGHRIGTMEVESALVGHPDVAEAAVVGRPDSLKGQALVAYVTLKAEVLSRFGSDAGLLKKAEGDLKAHVAQSIGALARPDDIRFAEALPKTRSGKIMRRLLRELASNGRIQGDTTTLEDLGAVAALQGLKASDEE